MYLTQTPELKRGDSLLLNFEYTDYETNLPLNLSECSFRLYIRNVRTNNLVIAATSDNGLLIVEPLCGIVKLIVPAHMTVDLIPGRYMYDLELTAVDGTVTSSETNYIEVTQDVTT